MHYTGPLFNPPEKKKIEYKDFNLDDSKMSNDFRSKIVDLLQTLEVHNFDLAIQLLISQGIISGQPLGRYPVIGVYENHGQYLFGFFDFDSYGIDVPIDCSKKFIRKKFRLYLDWTDKYILGEWNMLGDFTEGASSLTFYLNEPIIKEVSKHWLHQYTRDYDASRHSFDTEILLSLTPKQSDSFNFQY